MKTKWHSRWRVARTRAAWHLLRHGSVVYGCDFEGNIRVANNGRPILVSNSRFLYTTPATAEPVREGRGPDFDDRWGLEVLVPRSTREPVQALDPVRAAAGQEHGDRCDAGVAAAVSWTYISGERAEESLLRIRRVLKEPRGWWTSQDEESYAAALSEARTEGGESQ